jgi:septum formation inhibitor-activating ATPase MinD
MAKDMNVPFLGKIPLDTKVALAAEKGESILNSGAGAASNAYKEIVSAIAKGLHEDIDLS